MNGSLMQRSYYSVAEGLGMIDEAARDKTSGREDKEMRG